MNNGTRTVKDLLWIVTLVAGSLAVYKAVFNTGFDLAGQMNTIIALGAVSALILAVITYGEKASAKKDDTCEVDMEFGAWKKALTDNPARVSLLAVVAIPLATILVHADVTDFGHKRAGITSPRSVDPFRTVLAINGDRDADRIIFDHEAHKELAGEGGCDTCHHLDAPGDETTACARCHSSMKTEVSIFDHEGHQAELGGAGSCGQCHDLHQAKSARNAAACAECHEEMTEDPDTGRMETMAPSYPNAMHGACVSCHREMSSQEGNGCLACCDSCHQEVGHESEELLIK